MAKKRPRQTSAPAILTLRNQSGDVYRGRDAVDVVAQMRDASFANHEETTASFMRKMASRVILMSGVEIRTTSEKLFVEDLLQAEYLFQHQDD